MVDCTFLWSDEWGGLFGDACPQAGIWLGTLFPPGIALDACSDDQTKILNAAGDEFERIFFEASEIFRMIDPRETGYLQADWIRVTKSDTPYPHLIDTGSQSADRYLEIAASYGYTDVTYGHVTVWTCVSPCTEPIYGEEWNNVIIVEGTSLGSTIDAEFEAQVQARRQLGTVFVFLLA